MRHGDPQPDPAPPPPPGGGPARPRRSLSWRLLWFTCAVMLGTELLMFVPAMQRVRREWLDARIVASQIAVQALPAVTAPGPPLPGATPDRATREELLRLAGVASIRLQEPGRPMVVLAPMGQLHTPGLLDLRTETAWSRFTATIAALTRDSSRLVMLIAPSPKRPAAVLSIAFNEADLNAHLRQAAGSVALHGLAVAVPTGVLVHVSLLLLLVRPMRRLTGSIAAFRADPERGVPLEAEQIASGRDEISVAAAELAAMQRELRAALWRNARLAALGTAVAKVSHDLRGILSPALLTAERLQGSEDPKVRRSGDTLMRTVERATDLVKHTLDFAREVPAAPRREPVRLREVVEEAAEQVRATNPATSIEDGLEETTEIHADRTHLLRAFANLMRNAAQAGASRVFVSAATEQDSVAITISDNGPGLPESIRRSLFMPFVTGGRPGGTGLGLAITRDLLRAHGGDIALMHSSRDGTEFRLTLPVPPEARRAESSIAGSSGTV